MHGPHPGFLLEFALCAHERRFAGVELARRQLVHPAASGVTVLPEQADAVLVVDGDDRRAARVMRDFERRDRAVGQPYLLDGEPDHPAPEDSRGLHAACVVSLHAAGCCSAAIRGLLC